MANVQYYDVILKAGYHRKKHERYGRQKIHLFCSSGSNKNSD